MAHRLGGRVPLGRRRPLPVEQREVLILIGANGLTYDEAADVIGCAIGTVKSRLARGRKSLAELINGTEDCAMADKSLAAE